MCKDSNDTVAREPYLSTLLQAAERRRQRRGAVVPDGVASETEREGLQLLQATECRRQRRAALLLACESDICKRCLTVYNLPDLFLLQNQILIMQKNEKSLNSQMT